MYSPTGKCGDQHHQGALRQVKVGDQAVHGPEAVPRIDKMSVHRLRAEKLPSSAARDSRVRQEVVPTQMILPPRRRVSLSSSAVCSVIIHSSLCM